MSFYGFKKQLNKTSQYLSEKVGGNKGSQLEEDFVGLERKIDATEKCITEMHRKSIEYLQPNPTARTKLAFQASMQKARGQAKSVKYPQPEQMLADVFTRGGAELNDDSPYANSLTELGEKFHEMAEIKESMESNVKQNFLDPLFQLQQKDLKEISHHRKKLESRRLDFDYKKGKGAKVSADELQMAEEKFEESKDLCYNSMMNFIDSDTEHIGQLHVFAEAIRDYHRQCSEIMDTVVTVLSEKLSEAASRPRDDRTFISRPKFSADNDSLDSYELHQAEMKTSPAPAHRPNAPTISAPVMPAPAAPRTPSARGLYDFEPENEGELEFKEGDIIELTSRLDENWLEGVCNGKTGYFPENYVEILVPL
ncbi:endophilin-A3-like [Hydractinia symbiolongicarpus]|uniref:endophilin-A3-like n=1 Tax=Hydractinia symbiolongicarpus TaxID=13093 RepID=UPI0025507695|nr:endophilin-A3-like [Hydractinia symbiolongicarpus]